MFSAGIPVGADGVDGRRPFRCGPTTTAGGRAVSVHVRDGAAAAGDHRDVQLIVQVLAPQKCRRARDHAGGGQGAADQFASGYLTL